MLHAQKPVSSGDSKLAALKRRIVELEKVNEEWQRDFDASADLFMIIDKDFKIIKVNRTLCDYFGLNKDKLIGRRCYKMIHKTDSPPDSCGCALAKKTKHSGTSELFLPDKRRWLTASYDPILDDDGNITGFVHSLRDITEKKLIEKALKESEANYREIFNAVNDAIFVHDIQTGRILDVNKKMCEMYGCSVEEAKETTVADLSSGVPPYTQKDAEKWIKRAAYGMPQLFEWKAKDKSGRLFWVEVNLQKINVKGEDRILAVVRDISDRKRIEGALRLTQFTVDRSPEAIFWIDSNARIHYVNDQACRSLGYSREKLLQMSVPDVDPDFPLMAWPSHWRELKKKRKMLFESHHRKKDGTVFPVEISINYLVYENREFNIASARDITERKTAEIALLAERNKAQNYFDIAAVMLVALNAHGRVTLINKNGCDILGYDSDDIIGKSWFTNFIPTKNRRQARDDFKDLMAENVKPAEYFEKPVLTKTGEIRLVAWHNTILKDESGNNIGTLSSGEDVTEKRLAEEKTLIANKRLDYLLSSTTAVIYSSKVSGDYGATFVSKNVKRMAGYESNQFTDESSFWRDHIHPDDLDHTMSEAMRVFKLGHHSYEYRFLKSDGEYIWVRDEIELVRDKSGKPLEIVGFWVDITENKKLDEMKSNLIRDVSHGLKTPIALTEMAMGICEKGIQSHDYSNIRSAHRIARDNMRTLRKDVDNILALSAISVRDVRSRLAGSTRIKTVINEFKRVTSYILENKKISFSVDVSPDTLSVPMPPSHLKYLIGNVLDNAVKFTSEGKVHIRARSSNGNIVISVKDEGCGIVPADLDRVFERFYKRNPAIDGSGLGLAICEEIVDLYKGKIVIESEGIGKGTKVTITLPKRRK